MIWSKNTVYFGYNWFLNIEVKIKFNKSVIMNKFMMMIRYLQHESRSQIRSSYSG